MQDRQTALTPRVPRWPLEVSVDLELVRGRHEAGFEWDFLSVQCDAELTWEIIYEIREPDLAQHEPEVAKLSIRFQN